MLKQNASREEILETFPMLEGMTETELTMLKEDCEDSPAEEDKPLAHAVGLLLERMDKDDIRVPA